MRLPIVINSDGLSILAALCKLKFDGPIDHRESLSTPIIVMTIDLPPGRNV